MSIRRVEKRKLATEDGKGSDLLEGSYAARRFLSKGARVNSHFLPKAREIPKSAGIKST